MKKLIYFAAVTLLLNSFMSCNTAPPTDGTTTSSDINTIIKADISKLQTDLTTANLLSPSPCSTIFPASAKEEALVLSQRNAYQTHYKLSQCIDGHYGIICLNDIFKMMAEDPKNNAIIVYPFFDKMNVDSINIYCRGANFNQIPAGNTLTVPSNAGYYLSTWCPAVCPNGGCGTITPATDVPAGK